MSRRAGLLPAAALLLSCTHTAPIAFDVGQLDDQGLQGGVAVDYEFCIPADESAYDQVREIDSTARVMKGSRGRIGCTAEQWLVTGNTHQPAYRRVLERLAALPGVDRIERTWWE